MMIPIDDIKVAAYRIPTDFPESDGTLEWNNTTLVIVHVYAQGKVGMGYTYAHAGAAYLIKDSFIPLLLGENVLDIPGLWEKMLAQVRNIGWRGIAATAISAIDIALWDLKAKIFNVPLCQLFGCCHERMTVYGSGGFISYPLEKLAEQLEGWLEQGISQFKIKIGHQSEEDLERVYQARQIIGDGNKLFVDANGAYSRKEALFLAEHFADFNVQWFEEPVSSDDLEGLTLLRNRAPAGMDIAAGEYGYEMFYFRRMLEQQAVDVLQADATRCGGFTGFLYAANLSRSFNVDLSSHTAPGLHLHVCLSIPHMRHMEYFHDHVRIEQMFFEGITVPQKGMLTPDLTRPGLGLELKEESVQEYLIFGEEKQRQNW